MEYLQIQLFLYCEIFYSDYLNVSRFFVHLTKQFQLFVLYILDEKLQESYEPCKE
jgi:hypothetical protein